MNGILKKESYSNCFCNIAHRVIVSFGFGHKKLLPWIYL